MKTNTLYYGVLKCLKSGPMTVDQIANKINSKSEFVLREIQRIRQAGLFRNWIVYIPGNAKYVFVKELQTMAIDKIDWLIKQQKPKDEDFDPRMDLVKKQRPNVSSSDYNMINMFKEADEQMSVIEMCAKGGPLDFSRIEFI